MGKSKMKVWTNTSVFIDLKLHSNSLIKDFLQRIEIKKQKNMLNVIKI